MNHVNTLPAKPSPNCVLTGSLGWPFIFFTSLLHTSEYVLPLPYADSRKFVKIPPVVAPYEYSNSLAADQHSMFGVFLASSSDSFLTTSVTSSNDIDSMYPSGILSSRRLRFPSIASLNLRNVNGWSP